MALHLVRYFRCLSCDGTYQDSNGGGTIYFHVCPPLPPDENGVQAERPDKRDETIVTDRQANVVGIVSEGKGVVSLSGTRFTEPPWLTRLKANLPQDPDE